MKNENNYWFTPYDPARRIGTIISVSPTEATITLTRANESGYYFGEKIGTGEINEYVFIDTGEYAVLGKIVKVWITGNEKNTLLDDINQNTEHNYLSLGLIHILTSINSSNGNNKLGVIQYPRLGSQVYSAHSLLISNIIEGKKRDEICLPIANFPSNGSVTVHLTPEKLFSRHCAILGSTGGGKSYSLANLIEHITKNGGKAILIDATGEYDKLPCDSYYIGIPSHQESKKTAVFPHWKFSESDIQAFLQPSALSQLPKLYEAIRSLKLCNYLERTNQENSCNNYQEGLIIKAGQHKNSFESLLKTIDIDSEAWKFSNLAKQIENECIYPSQKNDGNKWGGRNENDISYCINLISRVNNYCKNNNLSWLIDPPENFPTVLDIITSHCKREAKNSILRFDLSKLPFESSSREILVNSIGKTLLSLARSNKISIDNPLIVFVDEAHQFLNKNIGNEYSKFALEAFGDIAKEGRKYGLNIVISTQRPRDIPEDVLSQIGSFIIHRITNPKDQDIICKSVGSIDGKSSNFLPILGQGEALLLGVDFPFPSVVKMAQPSIKPSSKSTKFSTVWLKASDKD